LAGKDIALLGVVKANGYGHGAVPVARTLEAGGIGALGVATPGEGMELRDAGIRVPIFLLAGPFGAPGDLLAKLNLTPVLYNLEQVRALEATLVSDLAVHLKVDTGMTRLGVLPKDLPGFIAALAKTRHLKLTGVLTHLAEADETFEGATAEQFRVFEEVEAQVRRLAPEVRYFHVANSAAILGRKLGPCNWARPGIMLYGSSPHPRFTEGERLKPVMHFETQVISLKQVPAGSRVSYGGEWTAQRPSRIAVLPVGYADGYIRHLSKVGEVLIGGRRVPVVGRVCMDLTMVDVTDLPDVTLGTAVTLWGPGLRAEEVAAWAGTISYELFCSVSSRVPRVYQGGVA
jgi:alanine racemase